MYCKKCGQQIEEGELFCPNCGKKIVEDQQNEVSLDAPARRNIFALLGFIFSFLSPALGVVFSIIGLNKAKQLNNDRKGLAIAGIVISVVTFIINLIITPYITEWLTEYLEEILKQIQ